MAAARAVDRHLESKEACILRIRRIFDDVVPANQRALEQVQAIQRSQFEVLDRQKIERIPEVLRAPLKYGFRSSLYVAEDQQAKVRGLAMVDDDAELKFCYLDYLASDKKSAGRGVGGALYERVRSDAMALGVIGLFFECLPDDPKLCRDPAILKQNRARLRFYETYGARPIMGTAYETPLKPGGDNPPYLMFKDLGQAAVLRAAYVRQVVACILQRKYKDLCSPEYVRCVLESIRDDPVRLRPPRYMPSAEAEGRPLHLAKPNGTFALVVTDQHEVHHVKERGYVESPVRIRAILKALQGTGLFESVAPLTFSDSWLTSVHDADYVRYFKRVCRLIEPKAPLYPYVFPVRNRTRPPVKLPVRAGYYCIDTFTPISANAYAAARRAVDCALTAANQVLSGRDVAYALVRPPGHHAERGLFGGFCYSNNAAIAAQYLCPYGKAAILDFDYHHGNGQQDIFYERNDVLTISIHGHPRFAYPYFTGFADERGTGAGVGYNFNYPLAETIESADYFKALRSALAHIRDFKAAFLIVCLGLDTAKGDPTGSWNLTAHDFTTIGAEISRLRIPILIVQEGGYNTRSIGTNARSFFYGIADGRGTATPRALSTRGTGRH